VSIERLAHPEWLGPVLAVLIAAGVALGAAHLRVRHRRRVLLGAVTGSGASLAGDVALLAALICTGIALLGPRIGERVVSAPASGADVVLLLDVSRSMDARDVAPSRLDRARRAAQELLARLEPQDRVALAAFAGRGVLLTPLTPDRDALSELLEAVDTDLVHPASSDLGAGVHAALEAFEAGSERPRVVFVLSDGEDPERRSEVGLAEAVRAEARVLAAGFGGDAGAFVPDRGEPLRDREGAAVVSRRRTERLERLTDATGGELFRADAWGTFDLDAATAAIRRDAGAVPGQRVERRVHAVRVLPFAALAFALLVLEGVPGRRGWQRGARAAPRGRRRGALLAAGAAALLGAAPPYVPGEIRTLEAELRAHPRDARLLLELGAARLERGRREAARRAFLAAALYAREPALAALAYYDLGVAHLEIGELEAARDAFFDAVALEPADRQARFNLEWTLEALAKSPPPGRAPATDSRDGEGAPPEDGAPREEAAPETPREPRTKPAPSPPTLSEEQRRRWLNRVQDDPARALRLAAPDGRSGRTPARRSGPAW
jgi:Mg-chelatase subunit ChlD